MDDTGCGNTINAGDPLVLRLIMDSLRYWLTEMRVDGFRFDLAPAWPARKAASTRWPPFFDIVSPGPGCLSQSKLVAEPWDVGQTDFYVLRRLPPLWREWNGKYHDTMGDFWRSSLRPRSGEFASRFCGSYYLFASRGWRPTASVNLITVHDGFTLADLVAYDSKHNEANGEANRDGTNDNRSWNCGAEGPTTDPDIVALRARQQRAMLTTLLLSFWCAAPARRRRARPHAAGQQQRLLPGQLHHLVRLVRTLTPTCSCFHRKGGGPTSGPPRTFRRRRFLAGAEASELGW